MRRWASTVTTAALLSMALTWTAPADAQPTDPTAATPTEPEANATAEAPFEWLAFPVVLYTPETNLIFSVGGLFSFKGSGASAGRPTVILPSLTYTLRGQIIGLLVVDAWLRGAAEHLKATAGYVLDNQNYYGVGNDVALGALEVWEGRRLRLETLAEHRVLDNLYLGVEGLLVDIRVDQVEAGGLLEAESPPGASGGLQAGAGLTATWDTRDDVNYPREGGLAKVGWRHYDPAIGSDFAFGQGQVDLRRYVPLGDPAHVVGVRALGIWGTGAPPVQAMATLGGSTLGRGLPGGRFRDRSLLSLQAEYRWDAFWRLGFTAFASAGQVMDTPGDARLNRFHPAGGLGARLRVTDPDTLNMRFDVGASEDSIGFYVQFLEAF